MKLLRSFSYAFNGLKICFISETNFRIHILLTAVVIVLGFVFKISAAEWLTVILCIAFVTVMEMMNTAIEKLCDMVHKETHPAIKKVKDIAAGAVLLAAISSVVIAANIFLPKIFIYIKSF